MRQSKQYNPVSAAIMQTGHTTVFPNGSHEDGGIASHVRQGMTPDFQICHLDWLHRWCSEAGQCPSAPKNWRKWVKRSQILLLNRRSSAVLYTSYESSLRKMPLPPLSSTEHLKVESTLLSQAAQMQTEQLSSKSKSKTTNCFDWSLCILLLKQG